MRYDDLTKEMIAELERPWLTANGHRRYTPIFCTGDGEVVHSSVNDRCTIDCPVCAHDRSAPLAGAYP